MKPSVSPHVVASLFLGLIAPLSAQNLIGTQNSLESPLTTGDSQRFQSLATTPGTYEVPAIQRAQSDVSDDSGIFAAQDAVTLDATLESKREVDSVIDLGVLRNPSPYRKMLVSAQGEPYQIAPDGLEQGLARISAMYREIGQASSDCSAISLSVAQQVKLQPSLVLEIVEREVGVNPGCACEIVKASISASEADVQQVVAIVETAIRVNPESMRIVSQCAIATMPESIAAVQALLAKLDPNTGDGGYSSKGSKDAKGAKVAAIVTVLPDPLDLPPTGPPLPPPPLFPPPVTDVNPCGPTS
jgi:hypothetical protein